MEPNLPTTVTMDMGDFAYLQDRGQGSPSSVFGRFPTSHDRSKSVAHCESLFER